MKKILGTSIVAAALALSASVVQAQLANLADGSIALKKVTGSSITPIQQSRLQEKLRLAAGIVAQIEQNGRAERLPANWRPATLSELYKLSNETLSAMQGVRSLADLPAAIANAKRVAPKALGDSTQDLTYTPIAPCRYIDTRDVGGKINGVRSYDIDLNSYTTAAGKCSSSPYGTFGGTLGALALNIAIFDTSVAPGVATIVPVSASTNNALVNWYEVGPSVQASNAAIVTIDQGAAANEIDIYTSSLVHVIVDVFGAFRANAATAPDCTTVASPSLSVPPGVEAMAQTPACGAGYSLTGGGCQSIDRRTYLFESKPAGSGSGSTWTCRVFNTDPALTGGFQAFAQCCRIPGR